MSNELALPANITPSKYVEQSTFSSLASGGGFLSRLQLFGANSDAVKEGKIPMGHYGIVSGKQVEDLGKEVQFYVLSWRPKALSIDGDEVVSCYDIKSDLFKEIQQKSEQVDSGCLWGPEFLVYLPSISKYATFYMSSKTSRRVAPDLKVIFDSGTREGIFKTATGRAELIKTKKYSWHSIVISICSQPLTPPGYEELVTTINAFNNPPEKDVEVAKTSNDERPR